MKRVTAYLAKAEAAERTASTIADLHDRRLLLAIAKEWRDLAKQAKQLAEWEADQAARAKSAAQSSANDGADSDPTAAPLASVAARAR